MSTPEGKAWKRNEQLKSLYGITAEGFEALNEKQGGLCKICESPASTNRFGRLYIDHCHVSGKIRGLLCSKCNMAIGLLRDCPTRIASALTYLQEG
ncbi:hypothetical protein ACR52_27355 [Pseudomonas fildesensis]|uniref:Recombination endonuclease VII n=1 Tax=Pseudomonas fildesensis TaxID=1674920 RepID=A0A0J8IL44_9PSED|nr:hypothetical protein ACR52_27355 [Pseudomonas fildesensis]